MTFGSWLSDQRERVGLTQRALARRCGITAGYIATIEADIAEPPPAKTCKVIARAIGIAWEDVWQRSLAARLRRWLRRQGHSGIPEEELVQFVKKILSTGR